MLIRQSVPGFLNRVFKSAAGIWVPVFDALVPRHQNILAVLVQPDGKLLIPGGNIVTNEGDLYYAQRGAAESPTNAFGIHVMASAGNVQKFSDYDDFTPISGSAKAHASTYPKTNDGDADNTGAGTDIVTYLVSYTKSDFSHAAITHGLITNSGPVLSPPTPILTGYAFSSSFQKTTNDTLKVFVNHEMLGV